jgi:hypothetical protein
VSSICVHAGPKFPIAFKGGEKLQSTLSYSPTHQSAPFHSDRNVFLHTKIKGTASHAMMPNGRGPPKGWIPVRV